MEFLEISNEFVKLANNKMFQNGLYLNTIIQFYAICKLLEKDTSKRIIITDVTDYIHKNFSVPRPNSANGTRHNNSLIRLGLIKLSMSTEDARVKNISLTSLGEKFKKLFIEKQ